jgi:hypothetical protein
MEIFPKYPADQVAGSRVGQYGRFVGRHDMCVPQEQAALVPTRLHATSGNSMPNRRQKRDI